MRICASLGKASDMERVADADMVEIRLDILKSVPDTEGKETIVTFRDGFDPDVLPKGFNGLADVGTDDVPDIPCRVISSHHDYVRTPDHTEIAEMLSSMKGDVVKGAYAVSGFADLNNIMAASKSIDRDHVLLGMGPMGTVTRIRQKSLGNLFTFAYVGNPTAPGQLSLGEMSALGDDCLITGLVGNPLGLSRSPAMHDAAYATSGIRGKYLTFETDSLEGIAETMLDYDIKGLNVTIPHKTDIIGVLDSIEGDAEKAGAVNTVVNDSGKLRGYNTDVHGVTDAIQRSGGLPEDEKVLVMGCGGSARASIVAALNMGAEVTIACRNADSAKKLANEFGVSHVAAKQSPAFQCGTVINCTPIGMYGDGEYPADVSYLKSDNLVLDMVYGTETPLLTYARKGGSRIASGEDVLASQGAKSFEIWTGVGEMFDVMRRQI